MWLSIIVPAYNCEAYLARCIDSLLQQGLQNTDYEILIIDDGSTDNTALIAQTYCEKHVNIKLHRQANSGVGAARNKGIDIAEGEYVEFVDADDWLLDGGLAELKSYYDPAKPCDMYTFYSHTIDTKYDHDKWDTIDNDHAVIYQGDFRGYVERYGFGWSVWSRIISKRLLDNSKVRFSSHKIGEDVFFLARLFNSPEALITATNLNIYRYFVHPMSAVNSVNVAHNAKACEGYIDIYGQLSRLASTSPYGSKIYESELRNCQTKTFIRMISGASSVKALKDLRARAIKAGALPIKNPVGLAEKSFNTFTRHISLLYPLSLFYRHIFLPHIKSRIGRN